jgi:phosphate-selective porin OprO/OprP
MEKTLRNIAFLVIVCGTIFLCMTVLDILVDKEKKPLEKFYELKNKVVKIRDAKKNDLIAFYEKGFRLETRDKNFKMQIGGRVQFDFRTFGSNYPEDDEFDIRRARIFLSGTVYRDFDYKVQVELEGSSSNRLRDGYLEYTYFKPNLKIKMGQFKSPFSVETLTSSKWVLFQERGLNSPIAPSRDVGIMLHGSPFDNLLTYYVGVFNGSGVDAEGEDNDDEDVALRLVVSPFLKTDISLLKDFHIAYNMTYGKEDDASIKFRTEARGATFFRFDDVDVDDRTRYGVDLNWIVGPLSLRGEWNRVEYGELEGTVEDVKVDDDLNIDAWYVALSWFLTGETPNFKKRIWGVPNIKNNFDPRKRTWGAFELAFRYSRFDADSDFWNLGVVSNEYTDEVDAFTLGLNWWLNPCLLFRFNYIHTEFGGKIAVDDKWESKEDAFTARFQLAF